MTKLSVFWTMLDKHDWYHEMSDDFQKDAKGEENFIELLRISEESDDHDDLLWAFWHYNFSGKFFGTPQSPKPGQPE